MEAWCCVFTSPLSKGSVNSSLAFERLNFTRPVSQEGMLIWMLMTDGLVSALDAGGEGLWRSVGLTVRCLSAYVITEHQTPALSASTCRALSHQQVDVSTS